VRAAIEDLIRPKLRELGYATNLDEGGFPSKDYLDHGDEFGYRSYHFFVKVPTPIDIYGNVELCLCEIQARTELQHMWAVKSHDLLYKPQGQWELSDKHVLEDMKQVSNSLRAADQFLVSIRDRTRRAKVHSDEQQ
jgi:ppGpp synthetase/RelA/SpoT-type nucleotidyltranferase